MRMALLAPRGMVAPRVPNSSSRVCNSTTRKHLLAADGPQCPYIHVKRTLIVKKASSSNSSASTRSSSSSSDGQALAETSASAGSAGSSCTIRYRGVDVEVQRGTTLRTALLFNGLSPHNGRAQLINCRGLGTCGTCAVEVRGEVLPTSWTTAEQLRLNFPPHKAPNNQRLRLACQVTCEGDQLQVIKRDKFWGQGDTILGTAGPEEYSVPLGELEFLLDRNKK